MTNATDSAPVRSKQAEKNNSRHDESRGRQDKTQIRKVRSGCIGRGQAGKTALFRALNEGPIGDYFPSGLHVDLGSPQETAQMLREAEETRRVLEMNGLPPTLEPSQLRYYLYDGDERRLAFQLREVIGQILTHTLPDSS